MLYMVLCDRINYITVLCIRRILLCILCYIVSQVAYFIECIDILSIMTKLTCLAFILVGNRNVNDHRTNNYHRQPIKDNAYIQILETCIQVYTPRIALVCPVIIVEIAHNRLIGYLSIKVFGTFGLHSSCIAVWYRLYRE